MTVMAREFMRIYTLILILLFVFKIFIKRGTTLKGAFEVASLVPIVIYMINI